MQRQHSPLPWHKGTHNGQTAIFASNGTLVATLEAGAQPTREQDAQTIIDAVNPKIIRPKDYGPPLYEILHRPLS